MNLGDAHRQLIVLGLEVAFILALAMVAQAAPGWGAPALVLLLLLWGIFLFAHSAELMALLGNPTPNTNVAGSSPGLQP